MPPLPRGRCPACHGDVALRKGGLLREHLVRKSQLQQRPDLGLAGTHSICPGSGKEPVA